MILPETVSGPHYERNQLKPYSVRFYARSGLFYLSNKTLRFFTKKGAEIFIKEFNNKHLIK